jgi:hypothetical protein
VRVYLEADLERVGGARLERPVCDARNSPDHSSMNGTGHAIATYEGVVNDPRRFQLLEGGMAGISHRSI